MAKEFSVIPLTLKEANNFITEHHRHNKKVIAHKFSLGCIKNEELIGVAVVGKPIARKLDKPLVAEITRLCIKEPAPKNACSFLYNKCWNIWLQMGGKKILTYTLTSEGGASLRGAGWDNVNTTKPLGKNAKGWETRNNRNTQAVYYQEKFRWEKSAAK